MKKVFEKIFGVKKSNTGVRPSLISDIDFEKKLRKNDIDFLIAYLKDGGNINRLMTVEEEYFVNTHEKETRNVTRLPLDLVERKDIRDFMRRHGAISYTECPDEIQRYEEELRRKDEEAKKFAEQKRSEEIQNKIKDYESGL